jgi:hypothetical protein
LKRGPSPSPVFSQLQILKGFKSCVLKLRILQELRARFAELRIIRGIVSVGPRRGSTGSVGDWWRVSFNTEGTEFAEEDGYPPPRVFFVRAANTGLMLDAASRMARRGVTEGLVCRLEGLKVGMLKNQEESD